MIKPHRQPKNKEIGGVKVSKHASEWEFVDVTYMLKKLEECVICIILDFI